MYKMKLFRFTRTASCIDLRTTADVQRIAEIRKRARNYECRNYTRGYSHFDVQ